MATNTINQAVHPDYCLARAVQAARQISSGKRAPSLKLALLFALCSGANRLEDSNSNMAEMLRPYADCPLPDRDVLAGMLRVTRSRFSGQTLYAMERIDWLWQAGFLGGVYSERPECEEEWQEWRRCLVALIPGMSYKMVSMAAYLMWPFHSPFVIVDRHHNRWLGFNPNDVPSDEATYLRRENMVRAVYQACDIDNLVNVAVWAHYVWSYMRKMRGCETNDQHAASHARLNVRTY